MRYLPFTPTTRLPGASISPLRFRSDGAVFVADHAAFQDVADGLGAAVLGTTLAAIGGTGEQRSDTGEIASVECSA